MWVYRPALWALCSKVQLLTLTCLHVEVLGVYISRSAIYSHDREALSNKPTLIVLQMPEGQQAAVAAHQQAAPES